MSLSFAYGQNEMSEDDKINVIVGGFKVDIDKVPYQAALLANITTFWCGGTIIGPRWILTSYHCIATKYPTNFSIVAGQTDPREGERIPIEQIIIHPYTLEDDTYDFALLKLSKSLVYSKKVQCIPLLASKEAIVPEKPAYVSGYGNQAEIGSFAGVLKAATIKILPWEACRKVYPTTMREYMVCAGFLEGGTDSCSGDSGGPLVVDEKLAGVVYSGRGCARPNRPGKYISIPYLYDFIVQTVQSQPTEEERELC